MALLFEGTKKARRRPGGRKWVLCVGIDNYTMDLKGVLWDVSRDPGGVHRGIFWRISRGMTFEEARLEVFSLYEKDGDNPRWADGTPGDPVLLLSAIFPELDRGTIKAATRYYQRQSRRLKRWAAKRGLFSRALNKRPRPQPARQGIRPRRTAVIPATIGAPVRGASRVCHRTAAKSGDDSGDGDGDPDAEPPAGQYCNLTLPAPSWAQQSLSEINHSSFPSLRRYSLPHSWRFVWGCSV
jgi:hypothetical protein